MHFRVIEWVMGIHPRGCPGIFLCTNVLTFSHFSVLDDVEVSGHEDMHFIALN